ncbi:MAG: hypothetical protein ACLR5H_04440 [Oscillospiraceae bacterium]
MLSKLLRHEFRATGRIMLPVYALLLVSCGAAPCSAACWAGIPRAQCCPSSRRCLPPCSA